MNKFISVIGGDDRQIALIHLMKSEGFTIRVYGFDKKLESSVGIEVYHSQNSELFDTDLIFMPIPCTTDGVQLNAKYSDADIDVMHILKHVKPNTLVIMGKASEQMYDLAMNNHFIISDILKREDFAVLNSIPSAEGALQVAMENTDITIHDSRCMVLGFGRLGKALTRLLLAMGATVTATARKEEDLAWIKIYGAQPMPTSDIEKVLHKQDIIFNTIPVMILGQAQISLLPKHCLVLDLASYPGGVDFVAAKEYGIKALFCPGLPGKVAPVTAAKYIWDVTKAILKEAKPDAVNREKDRIWDNGFVLYLR